MISKCTAVGLAALVLLVALCGQVLADGLRTCPAPDCSRHALSDVWLFCPFCGTELPKPEIKAPDRERIIGNIYQNPDKGFQIERPNEKWRFLTLKTGLQEMNDAATVGIVGDDTYCLVIIEQVPEADPLEYADLVAPSLDDLVMVSEKVDEHRGCKAVRREWTGRYSGIEFAFFTTVIQKGETFFQVVCWCARGMDTRDLRAAFDFIAESLRFYDDPGKTTPQPTEPERDPPKDRT